MLAPNTSQSPPSVGDVKALAEKRIDKPHVVYFSHSVIRNRRGTCLIAIDTEFDFQTDAGGGDPDSTSPTLRRYHKALWSKPLPDGTVFTLRDDKSGAYLYHTSNRGEFFLSSDTVIPTFIRRKRYSHIIEQIPTDVCEKFWGICYTMGGMMIFPGNRINGAQTINGTRGFNSKISDRFDLTLECIRRFYIAEESPLSEVFARYDSFFGLFENFVGYVKFFLLQDLVSPDFSKVSFFMPFSSFSASPFPADVDQYYEYMDNAIGFVRDRNMRIAQYCCCVG